MDFKLNELYDRIFINERYNIWYYSVINYWDIDNGIYNFYYYNSVRHIIIIIIVILYDSQHLLQDIFFPIKILLVYRLWH